MAGNDGIIRSSIIIDSSSVKSMMQSIKELKEAVVDLKANGKGSSMMFQGELAGVKELQGVIKQLQADMKALKESAGKSSGVDSMTKDTSEKLKTLQQQLRDIQVLKDAAFQTKDTAGLATYGAQETAKYRELIAFQNTLTKAQDAQKAKTTTQAINTEIKALDNKLVKLNEVKALEQKFPGTTGKTIGNIDAEINGLTRQKQLRQDILSIQNDTNLKTANANFANGEKGMRAYDAAQRKSYDTYMSQLTKKYNAEDKGIQNVIQKYDALNAKLRDYAATNTQISERQFLAMQRQAKAYEASIVKGGIPNNTGISPIIGQSYKDYSATIKPPDYQSYTKSVSAARMEAERLHQVMSLNNTAQTRLDFKNARDGLQHSVKLQEQFNSSISTGIDRVGMLGSFSQKLRKVLAA